MRLPLNRGSFSELSWFLAVILFLAGGNLVGGIQLDLTSPGKPLH